MTAGRLLDLARAGIAREPGERRAHAARHAVFGHQPRGLVGRHGDEQGVAGVDAAGTWRPERRSQPANAAVSAANVPVSAANVPVSAA
jgi:hypothetical protein